MKNIIKMLDNSSIIYNNRSNLIHALNNSNTMSNKCDEVFTLIRNNANPYDIKIAFDNLFVMWDVAVYEIGFFIFLSSVYRNRLSNDNGRIVPIRKNVKNYYLENGIDELGNLTLEQYKEALKTALDIRKFEIERYWIRAAYFWAFIAACFTAYGVTLYHEIRFLAFMLSFLGMMASISFWLVTKGCKFWQQNWEMHVDALEYAFMGDLYKTVLIASDVSRFSISKAWPISVSKVNQYMAFMLIIFWGIIFFVTIFETEYIFELEWYTMCHSSVKTYSCLRDYMLVLVFYLVMCLFVGKLISETETSEFKGWNPSNSDNNSWILHRKRWWQ